MTFVWVTVSAVVLAAMATVAIWPWRAIPCYRVPRIRRAGIVVKSARRTVLTDSASRKTWATSGSNIMVSEVSGSLLANRFGCAFA